MLTVGPEPIQLFLGSLSSKTKTKLSIFEKRLSADARNREVSRERFPEEIADLEFFNEQLENLPKFLAPLDKGEVAMASDLYQMSGELLISASLSVMSAKGIEALMYVRKSVEAIAYANRIARDREAGYLYRDRRKRSNEFRDRFRRSRIFPEESAVRDRLLWAYDLASDAGTHANLEGFIGRRRVVPQTGGTSRVQYGIYDTDEQWLHRHMLVILQVTVETYATALDIFRDYLKDPETAAKVLAALRHRLGQATQRYLERWGDTREDAKL